MGAFNNWPYTNTHELNLDWLISEVKRLAVEWNTYNAEWDKWQDDTNKAYQSLHDYVMNYFLNLDIDQELQAKLDQIAEDGTLANLLGPFVPPILTEWLNENITPTSPVVDKSLLITGAAADAKTVGDYILPVDNGNIPIGNYIENSYASDTGIVDYNGWHRTDYIEIDPTKTLYITKIGEGYPTGSYNVLYDANKNVLQTFRLFTGEQLKPLPINARYMILSDINSVTYRITNKENILRDKLIEHRKTPGNLFPVRGWLNATITSTGSLETSYYRLTSDKIPVRPGGRLEIKNNNPDYYLSVNQFSKNNALLYSTSYGVPTTVMDKNADYVRFSISKTTENTYIYQDIIPDTDFVITYTEEPYNSNAIEVMTYNMGGFAYGIGYGIPTDIYDEKIANYRNFLGKYYPDIMGIQEYSTVIRYNPEIRSNPALWDKYYPYEITTGGSTALKSRYPLANGRVFPMTETPDRYLTEAWTNIDGKEIYLLSCHLSPEANGLEKRKKEMQEIKNLLDQHKYSILFGDFNTYPGEDAEVYGILSNAGYKLANTGDMGAFWSWSSNRDDFTHYDSPTGTIYNLDNIIVSSNIDILEVEPLNVYNYLTSDHIPIRAKIVIK